jgi:hypothetical protein
LERLLGPPGFFVPFRYIVVGLRFTTMPVLVERSSGRLCLILHDLRAGYSLRIARSRESFTVLVLFNLRIRVVGCLNP